VATPAPDPNQESEEHAGPEEGLTLIASNHRPRTALTKPASLWGVAWGGAVGACTGLVGGFWVWAMVPTTSLAGIAIATVGGALTGIVGYIVREALPKE